MWFDESWNHGGTSGVQHSRGEQQQCERRVSDGGLLKERRENRADGEQRAQTLTDDEQTLARIAVSEEPSERPDQEQGKRSDE